MSSRPKPDPIVARAASVWIDLRPPRHGWLDCTIDLGDFRLETCASWVDNDPLEELVDMGCFLARGASGTRRVCLWTEPAGYAIDVWNMGDTLSGVRIGSATLFLAPMAGRALRREHDCIVDRAMLAAAILRGVDALFQSAGPAIARPHWHDPARYADTLAQLRERAR